MTDKWSRARVVSSCALAALLAACAGAPATREAAPSAVPAVPRDAATAAAIGAVLAGGHRSAENRARDAARHPLDTLLFFGIKPDMTVAEVWPDAGGWYTEILAPLLAAQGRLYVAQLPPAPRNAYVTARLAGYQARLAARPDLFGKVSLTTLGAAGEDIAPPGSCDLVVTFDSLHSWMNLGSTPQALAAMHRALKPGGILGMVGHRGPAGPQDPRATNGYVDEQYAIALVEAAGFELVARSDINANPNDTKDYLQGVWSLPPDYRQGKRDRAKFEAIGESDRFTLKFRKKGAALTED